MQRVPSSRSQHCSTLTHTRHHHHRHGTTPRAHETPPDTRVGRRPRRPEQVLGEKQCAAEASFPFPPPLLKQRPPVPWHNKTNGDPPHTPPGRESDTDPAGRRGFRAISLSLSCWALGTTATVSARPPTPMVESNGHRSTAPAAAGFFRVPGLFVRLSSKGGGVKSNAVDPDSVWSPTSPLDFKSLRSSPPRVGLGLVDALTADETGALHLRGRSSFLDSIKPFLDLALRPKAAAVCGKAASSAGVATSLDEVDGYADSEEYTCVISRGANPRTTHILAGETVEVRRGDVRGCRKVIFSIEPLSDQQPSTSSSPAAAATSVASGRCCCCMKRLPEDRDIFIYMGEKAFCSNECRKGYIEEEIEEAEELMILDSAFNL